MAPCQIQTQDPSSAGELSLGPKIYGFGQLDVMNMMTSSLGCLRPPSSPYLSLVLYIGPSGFSTAVIRVVPVTDQNIQVLKYKRWKVNNDHLLIIERWAGMGGGGTGWNWASGQLLVNPGVPAERTTTQVISTGSIKKSID